MIQLSQGEKDFIKNTLKPYLKSDDMIKVRKYSTLNILAFLMEAGIDVFDGLYKITRNDISSISEGREKFTFLKIPSHVKEIGDHVFYNTNLKTIVFEEGVRSIGDEAFCLTQIENVVLPNSLEKLGKGVFAGCENLKSVFIPDGITRLPKDLFKESNPNVIVYANSRKDMPSHAKLRCFDDEVEWYAQHLKMKED